MKKQYFPEKNRSHLSPESGGGLDFLALALLEAFCVTLSKSRDPSGDWVLSFAEGVSWNQALPSCGCHGSGPSSSAIAGSLPPAVLHRSQAGSECRSSGLIFQMEVISPVLLGKKGSDRPGTEAVQYFAEKTAWGCVGALTASRTLTESAFQGSPK